MTENCKVNDCQKRLLVAALEEARLQLEYLHEKHGYATTETALTRIRATLADVGSPGRQT